MKKRILSLALVVFMLAALSPIISSPVALATGHGSNGKFLLPIDPPAVGSIPVSTRAELEAIQNNLAGTYHLTANIDLFGTEWIPIGGRDNAFTGIFDGQGYVIRNLAITGNQEFAGLFGRTSDAIIRNVGIENKNIRTSVSRESYAGGICGHNNGVISNCYTTGAISMSVSSSNISLYAGGICGYNTSNSSIRGCYSTSSVSASRSSYAGGISGYNYGIIDICHFAGSANAEYVGGICGYIAAGSTVSNSYNSGITGDSTLHPRRYSGGISGSAEAGASITNSYNTGSINASAGGFNDSYSGGIVGYNNGALISNSYNTGSIFADAAGGSGFPGGICGYNRDSNSISNSYWNIDSDQQGAKSIIDQRDNTKKGIGDGSDATTSLTSAQMQQQSSFSGWDFRTVWGFKAGTNNGYPVLRAFHPDIPAPPPEAPNLNTADGWAQGHIQSAFEKGFIPEDLQNSYKNKITRAEFARMAVKWVEYALGQPINTIVTERGIADRIGHTFTDTTNTDILAAYRLGIISGSVAPTADKPGTFNPSGEITRQEAAVMITNTCKAIGANVSNPSTADFGDMDKAAGWAYPGINFVRANGIMSGSDGNFNPNGTYTRQESITTFNNIKHNELPGR